MRAKRKSDLNFQTWTADALRRAKQMWWDGDSYSKIALALNFKSPRAVKAKAERMGGWPRNPRVTARIEKAFRQDPQDVKLKREKGEPVPLTQANGEAVTMENCTRHQCQWMIGEPGAEAAMCGHPTVKGKRWCEFHYDRAGGAR